MIKNLLIAAAISTVSLTGAVANDALIKQGKDIFMTKNKGNCLACHAIEGMKVDGPGSMGPKLQALQYWPDEALYDKVYDPYTTNPISAMPAFGKNGWLSDSEIKAVVAFLKTIK
ncbi:sulfur oxidation c-type cytochrome SoxX [Arcobacter sp. YIC-464]|uniref:sulfur oxidation c-type cytochrome SoxX n=1 Tax=Arcobacter sp. YIC-464 TaxID=3376631 RepID=UPI003C18B86E